jgi:UDP-N-acetylmuramoyl-L-alanyl-D-glutamate--2,6-diaminopimelate ligase
MCGIHNIYNAVGVIAAATSALIAPEQSCEYLKNFKGVPGRMQHIENSKGLHIFVDYAHSPDALEKILLALGKIRSDSSSPAKIWSIFGCGGDRDKGKRPMMAQVAERYSDFVMVTSDNPRTEEPQQIITEIMLGFSEQKPSSYTRIFQNVDRRLAIESILAKASPGDVVVIAGKGHENYQIIGTQKHHFSDVEIVKEYFK